MSEERFTVTFAEPNHLTDGDETELTVRGYDDLGSMYSLELVNGSTRSIGKQLVEEISAE
ncbi:MAG: hypothetical protein ACI9K3_001334 [Halovenus sp.]|jgi:hypothetical protein